MTTPMCVQGTFRGGTHPPENKHWTAERRILPGPFVKQVTVLLSQHIGAPCAAVVQKGDTVHAGQKIGDAEAFVSAPVHSPIAGKVKEISLQSHPVVGRTMGVVIEAEAPVEPVKPGQDERFVPGFDANLYTAEQIGDAIRQAGIVGLGGAGFPTRVKVDPNPKLPKDTILINGCECEPFITCDYRVMMEWTHQIIVGVKLLRRACGCDRVFIAIEDNKPRAIEGMKEALDRSSFVDKIQVVRVKTKYPQGGERQLIQAVTGRTVPTGGIPPMIGVVVVNVATAAAIADAVVLSRPLTHRVVNVTGDAVAEPGNLYVPIGTAVGDLIQFCGGVTRKSAKVILGGPMMGIAIADLAMPITKTTGAVTVLSEEHVDGLERPTTPCIRCGRCIQACPEHLNPTRIAHAVMRNAIETAQQYYLQACIECGCCSYVCPAHIELTGWIKTGKIFVARQKRKMPQ